MRINLLKGKCLASLTVAFCFGALWHCPLIGEETKQKDTASMIDEFIMSDEFKAAEEKKLHDLPVDAVELLTRRLNGLNADTAEELRVYGCLVSKVRQFDAVLAREIKSDALAALKAKIADQQSPHYSQRIRLYESVSPTPGSPSDPPEDTQPPVVGPPAMKKVVKAKQPTSIPSEDLPSSTPWIIIVVLIVAATGLLWLLVKKRK